MSSARDSRIHGKKMESGRTGGHASGRSKQRAQTVHTVQDYGDGVFGPVSRGGYGRNPNRQRPQRPLHPTDPRAPTAKRQGLTREEVAQLVEAQNGACALCKRPLADEFAIDHDHVLAESHGHDPLTGCKACVRGALCLGCNSWLSSFRDDSEFLRRAADYAERRRKR